MVWMRYICAIAIIVLGLGIPSVEGADLRYWDVNASANLQTGSGTWDDSTTLWSDSTAGSDPLLSWSPDGIAYFTPDGPATVTVEGALTAAGLVFDGTNYTVTGGMISLGATGITANVDATIGSILTGSEGLLKQGSGTLILTGVNDYMGTTTIDSGTLQLGADTTTGSLGGGPLDINGRTLTIDRSNAMTFTNALSGAGTILKKGSSTTTYDGISTFSGTLQLSAGTFVLGVIGTNGLVNGNMTGLGVMKQDRNATTTRTIEGTLSATTYYGASKAANFSSHYCTLNVNAGGTATFGTMWLASNNYDNYGTVQDTVNISGTLTATTIRGWLESGSGGLVTVNRYINVNAGGRLNAKDIRLDWSSDSGNTHNRRLTLNSGTLANISSGDLYVDSLTPIRLLGSPVIDVSSGRTATLTGTVYDSGSLTKTGEGTLALAGAANTYTGDTIVSNGVLSISHSWLGGSSATVRIATGATVNLASGVNAEVESLYMGGFQYQAGTWGGPDSEAQFKKSGYFTGTGMITVQEGVFAGLMYYAK